MNIAPRHWLHTIAGDPSCWTLSAMHAWHFHGLNSCTQCSVFLVLYYTPFLLDTSALLARASLPPNSRGLAAPSRPLAPSQESPSRIVYRNQIREGAPLEPQALVLRLLVERSAVYLHKNVLLRATRLQRAPLAPTQVPRLSKCGSKFSYTNVSSV
jgi:hypothetical protein